ncbi:MAG: PQQ-binding-like beta-propeller repeat protein [Planctomycetia bacterium]|nr:PQQ-binding-like beta-propeller repeat protein [Planctomycetia bacterium]
MRNALTYRAALAAIVLGWVVATARADWLHWRGDGGNGVSLTARPPVAFGLNANLRWKAEISGRGSSSPVVVGDRVFVTTAVPVDGEPGIFDFRLICFDRENGRENWSRSCVKAKPHEGTHETNGFASASPCSDGERVYAHFGSRGLHCYAVDGKHLWSRDFGDMTVRHGFGEGSSPTLAGDLLIVPWDHEGPSMLFAVDRRTGKSVWETPRDEPTCWATPLVVADAGGTMQVVMNGQKAARGYELTTGRRPPWPLPAPPPSAAGFAARSSAPSTWPAAATSLEVRTCDGQSTRALPTSPRRCCPATGFITIRRRPACSPAST